MSISLVVTRGYSNGTLVGSIADVVRRGYSPAAAAPAAARVTGGWLSPEQVAKLRNIIRDAERDTTKESKRNKRRAQERIAELETIFDEIQGIIPPEDVQSISDVVRPFSAASDAPLPPIEAIDFQVLLKSMEAVQALANALVEASLAKQEEESLMLLMMTA